MIGFVTSGLVRGAVAGVVVGYAAEKFGKVAAKALWDSPNNRESQIKAGVWGSRIFQSLPAISGPYTLLIPFSLLSAATADRSIAGLLGGMVILCSFITVFSLAVLIRGVFVEAYQTHKETKDQLYYGMKGSAAAIVSGLFLTGTFGYILGAYLASQNPDKERT